MEIKSRWQIYPESVLPVLQVYLSSLLQINSNVTAKSLRPHFPCTGGPGLMKLTLTFRTRPFWCDIHPCSHYAEGQRPGSLSAPHGPHRLLLPG